MDQRQTAAFKIIKKLGTPAEVAALLGVHFTLVYHWRREGVIPAHHMTTILAICEQRRIRVPATVALKAVLGTNGAMKSVDKPALKSPADVNDPNNESGINVA